MTVKQWVNLEKKEIYAKDADIDGVERCGNVTVKVSFDQTGAPIVFTTRVTPVGSDNAVYTQAEEKRNANFTMTQGRSGVSEGDMVTLEDSIQLPAAGGNKYKIEAKDANGKVVATTVEVETKRKLYYQVMQMDDANGRVPAQSLSTMETHADKHHIVLEKKGSLAKIRYRKTITMQDGGSYTHFGSDVAGAYSLDNDHKDVGVAAVFSDYIADKATESFTQLVTPVSSGTVTVDATKITFVLDQFLWHGLDDADDQNKGYFVTGRITSLRPTTSAVAFYNIQRADVSISGTPYFTYGGYHIIEIARNAQIDAVLADGGGAVRIILGLNIVAGFTGGFSWNPGGVDLITVAKRSYWEDAPANKLEYTWNHEIGHRFGMTAYGHRTNIYGSSDLPDGPSTLYGENRGVNDQGHAGPHCGKGATYSAATGWSGTPQCVMFGADGTDTADSPNDYCSECEPIVRKVDLKKR